MEYLDAICCEASLASRLVFQGILDLGVSELGERLSIQVKELQLVKTKVYAHQLRVVNENGNIQMLRISVRPMMLIL